MLWFVLMQAGRVSLSLIMNLAGLTLLQGSACGLLCALYWAASIKCCTTDLGYGETDDPSWRGLATSINLTHLAAKGVIWIPFSGWRRGRRSWDAFVCFWQKCFFKNARFAQKREIIEIIAPETTRGGGAIPDSQLARLKKSSREPSRDLIAFYF
jgi:hypothetical protein